MLAFPIGITNTMSMTGLLTRRIEMPRKPLALFLAAVLATSLTSGCTQPASTPPKQEPQAARKPAPSPPPKTKIGLVFGVGGRGDLSFNDSAYAGLERAMKEYGDRLEVRYLEPDVTGSNHESLLRLLANEKYDLVFGVGFFITEHVATVAKEFPGVKFGLVDGWLPDLRKDSNVACLLFKEQEGSFLAGAVAAMKSKVGRVGFVGGMKGPLIERFEAGFVAGVRSVNPKANIAIDYIGTTSEGLRNPARAKELALKQYNAGADVIYHASGASGVGVIEAATSRRKFVIGVDSDQSLTATPQQRPYILTSMLKRVDLAVYETISILMAGRFEGGYRIFGLSDGGVGYALNDYNKSLITDIIPKIDDLKARIIRGDIVVPANNDELKIFLSRLGK